MYHIFGVCQSKNSYLAEPPEVICDHTTSDESFAHDLARSYSVDIDDSWVDIYFNGVHIGTYVGGNFQIPPRTA